jgi:hypothetical protein
MEESGGRRAPRSTGYGLVSHYHVYGHYLGWTCSLIAAGELLAKYPVHDVYSWSDEDPWDEWLGRRRLTRTDGLWLSDGVDPTPLETQVNLLEKDSKGLVLRSDKLTLLQLVGINGALGRELIVEGNWKSSDGIDVSVSSALIKQELATRAAARLAKTTPFHAWLPTLESDDGDEVIERSDGKEYEAWIVTPSVELRLDEDDPLGVRSAMLRPYFREEISTLGGLTTADPFGRSWTDPSGKVVARSQAWGWKDKYDEDSAQGQRLVCSLGFLKTVLTRRKRSLVLLIKIQQYKKDARGGEGKFATSTAVVIVQSSLRHSFIAGPSNRVI